MTFFTNAQTFTDIRAGLTGVAESSSGWMDTDRDGDPDIIVAGEFFPGNQSSVATRTYMNQRNDRFDLSKKGIPDFFRGDFSIGDADLDGIDDLAIVGETANGNRLGTIYIDDEFIGKVAQIYASATGGQCKRHTDDGKESFISGTKGFKWKKFSDYTSEKDVDMDYYDLQVKAAINDICEVGNILDLLDQKDIPTRFSNEILPF